MIGLMDSFWPHLESMLKAFADNMLASYPSLTYDVTKYANSAFLLRGYLEFRRSREGDDVAITIDVQTAGNQLLIETDICSGYGEIIAAGMSAEIALSSDQKDVERRLGNWFKDFQQFLQQNEPIITSSVSKLT